MAHAGEGSWWVRGKEGEGFTWSVWLKLGIPGCSHVFHAFALATNVTWRQIVGTGKKGRKMDLTSCI